MFVTLFAIWYYLHNFKKREKHTWRSVAFTESNTPPWEFLTFFKLHKWYQIAQHIAFENISLFRFWHALQYKLGSFPLKH